jgi:insertion element IS1 protein InsB
VVKQQIVDMAMNASGIRDTARVLHINPHTVLTELKKGICAGASEARGVARASSRAHRSRDLPRRGAGAPSRTDLRAGRNVELRPQQSEPAPVVARDRTSQWARVSLRLRASTGYRVSPAASTAGALWHYALLPRWWGAYERHIDTDKYRVDQENMQQIESKHINLRIRIKRLVRRTICVSKAERTHDLVIELFINRYEFG